ncbi:MAG: DUF2391 family protein [Bacillota bacterium]
MADKYYKFQRIGGYLHKVKTLKDSKGNILEHVVIPMRVEVRPRDILQVILGASVLALPLGMTEETWNLGSELPLFNVLFLAVLGIGFIAMFVYFNYYREVLEGHKIEMFKRVLMIYFLSLLLVAGFLLLIQKLPWAEEPMVAVKRLLLITFPCSMSATISDVIK